MQEISFSLPGMWADHHVLAVRELLKQDTGVIVVDASSRDLVVRLSFDESLTDADKIAARLSAAGYVPGAAGEETPPPTNKPAWATAGCRVTATDPMDLIMSGDHRKY
ncbi:MAG: heavy-metal-associated domain-containing protein [Thermoleophilia bacterium]